jgi:NADH-quinone oxidoreductase subunit J
MTVEQAVFLALAAAGLGLAILTVTARDLVRSAFALIGCLFAVAGLYALLEAGLLAAAQVVIYVGAIAVLIVLAVMLTAQPLRERGPQTHRHWPLAALVALILLAGLVWAFAGFPASSVTPPALPAGDSVVELGRALIDPQRFLVPFEATSVLLLAALVGAVTIARGGKRD